MKVSVITPSYNYANYIGTAIDSVTANFLPVEHVVMDGGSEDGTQEVLSRYGHKVVWQSEKDRGQSDALNKALKQASGDIIGWLNADDFYLPGALDRVAEEFELDPSLDVLYGDTILVDGEGKILRLYKCYPVPDSVLRWRGCTLMSTSTFFRKTALGPDPFDTELRMRMDWDLFLRLRRARSIKFKYLSEPLAAFRFHENQVTHNQLEFNSAEHLMIRKRYNIIQSFVPLTRSLGITIHRLNKLLRGAWITEKKSEKIAGCALLTESGHVDAHSLGQLRELCYR